MRAAEAKWIFEQLSRVGSEGASPVLHIGSSTAEFREEKKPHIQRDLFAPLADADFRVVHTDIRDARGVDLVGDVTDPDFIAHLRSLNFRAVICANLLEHVRDPVAIANACEDIAGDGGFIVATVPFSYPFHPDPIDTLYRPSPTQLASGFHRCEMIAQTVIAEGHALADEWNRGLRNFVLYPLRVVWRLLLAPRRPLIALAQLHRLLWVARRFKVSCVLLRVTHQKEALGPEPQRKSREAM